MSGIVLSCYDDILDMTAVRTLVINNLVLTGEAIDDDGIPMGKRKEGAKVGDLPSYDKI